MLAARNGDVHEKLTNIVERLLITRALAHTSGRRIEAAHALGIGRNTITRKIHELGLDAEREDVARRHLQELDDSAAELQALNSQIDRLQTAGLQLVRNRAALALSNYRSAKGDLSAVLSARAQVLETRMRLIDLGAQRDSLVARLNSLIAD